MKTDKIKILVEKVMGWVAHNRNSALYVEARLKHYCICSEDVKGIVRMTEQWYVEWHGGNRGVYEREGDNFFCRDKQGNNFFVGHTSDARLIRKETTDKSAN